MLDLAFLKWKYALIYISVVGLGVLMGLGPKNLEILMFIAGGGVALQWALGDEGVGDDYGWLAYALTIIVPVALMVLVGSSSA